MRRCGFCHHYACLGRCADDCETCRLSDKLPRVELCKAWPPEPRRCETESGQHYPATDDKGRTYCWVCGHPVPAVKGNAKPCGDCKEKTA